jgi:hypothetical protein
VEKAFEKGQGSCRAVEPMTMMGVNNKGITRNAVTELNKTMPFTISNIENS